MEDHPKKAVFWKFKGTKHLFGEVTGPSFSCPLPSHQTVSQPEGNSEVGFRRLFVFLIPLRMEVQRMQRIRWHWRNCLHKAMRGGLISYPSRWAVDTLSSGWKKKQGWAPPKCSKLLRSETDLTDLPLLPLLMGFKSLSIFRREASLWDNKDF